MYSALSQTTQRAIADNGPITTWEIGEVSNAEDANNFFNKYIAPYLSLSAPAKTLAEGHWNVERNMLNGENRNYNAAYSRAYLTDGTSLTLNIDVSSDTEKRIHFYADINGDKKPNKIGRDIFSFYYIPKHYLSSLEGKFIANGISNSRASILSNANTAKCNKNQYGVQCTALIIKDGWRIADDYPW